MEITEIRIKLMEDSEDRLRAFCSITIDSCFVVRDLKIIDGTSGPFVAMPSRKLSGHCQRCKHKNHLRATYCNQCGVKLQMDGDSYDSPQKLYADVAHPINSECREMIQNAVIDEFNAELDRYEQPGYRSRYDDDFDDEEAHADSSGARSGGAKSGGPKSGASKSGGAKSGNAKSRAAKSGSPKSSASKSGGPPRPHFIDLPDRDKSAPGPDQQDDDQFGAGVFS